MRIRGNCLSCKIELFGAGSSKCLPCSTKDRLNKRIKDWLDGVDSGTRKDRPANFIKTYLLERASHKCELCGFNTLHKTGRTILQVDHIDGHWDNNRPENLRLICPNCHCLTDNWGGANKGNGRKFRYE